MTASSCAASPPDLASRTPSLQGAARLRLALTDNNYRNGTFYASAKNTLPGPVIDQASIFTDLDNPTYQANANQAIHRFLH